MLVLHCYSCSRERERGDNTVVNESEDLWRIDAEISQVNGESPRIRSSNQCPPKRPPSSSSRITYETLFQVIVRLPDEVHLSSVLGDVIERPTQNKYMRPST